MLDPRARSMRARMAAYLLHANRDPRETTKAARAAFLGKFERDVDPEGILPPSERARRAEAARKAHFARLAFKRHKKTASGGNSLTVASSTDKRSAST